MQTPNSRHDEVENEEQEEVTKQVNAANNGNADYVNTACLRESEGIWQCKLTLYFMQVIIHAHICLPPRLNCFDEITKSLNLESHFKFIA